MLLTIKLWLVFLEIFWRFYRILWNTLPKFYIIFELIFKLFFIGTLFAQKFVVALFYKDEQNDETFPSVEEISLWKVTGRRVSKIQSSLFDAVVEIPIPVFEGFRGRPQDATKPQIRLVGRFLRKRLSRSYINRSGESDLKLYFIVQWVRELSNAPFIVGSVWGLQNYTGMC